MKKIIIILAVALAASAVSCKKETPLPEGGPATYKIASRSKVNDEGILDIGKFLVGDSTTVKFYATTRNTGVREQLTATVAVPFGPERYLESGVTLLPANCYTFAKNPVVIDRYNKNSRTAELKIKFTDVLTAGKKYGLPVYLSKVEGSERASVDTVNVIVVKMTLD